MTTRELILDYCRTYFSQRPAIWVGVRYILVESMTNRTPIASVEWDDEVGVFRAKSLTHAERHIARELIDGKAADI